MKELIDFDDQFNQYMDEIAEKLLKEGKKPEEIEELIPEMYEKWAKEAQTYFDGMSPSELTEMLNAYLDEEMSVPDILIDKISETPACEKAVYGMFCDERSDEDKILLMNILSDLGSTLPVQEYVRIVRRNEPTELTEAATEALKYADDKALVLEAYEEENDPDVLEKLMYALVYSEPKIKGLAPKLITLMRESEHKAIIAGMMAFYGDDACLEALKEAENDANIEYIDYVEICDAIEALGGETTREREFNGDDYYEMMQNGGIE